MQHAPELLAKWAELRDAGRALAARSRQAALEPLAGLLDEFALSTSPLRRRLAEELPAATGFDPATTRAGLDLALSEWTGDALHALVRAELGDDETVRARGFASTAVLLGGALPMPGILSLVTPLAVQSPVFVRSGRHDPVTARVVEDALRRLDPELAACVGVTRFPHHDRESWDAFSSAECFIATGSDETLAEIGGRLDPRTRFVAHGHRLSVAVIGEKADPASAADALALDVALWDQLGCLSPTAAWVIAPNGEVPAAIETELRRAFTEIATRLPRGAIDKETAAALAQERDGAELRAASEGRVRLHAADDWTLVVEDHAQPRPAPLHRFLRLHPVRDVASLKTALAPLAPYLAAIGLAAGADEQAMLVAALRDLAPSRIAPLGRMQAPPLAWHHDGQGVLWPLVRFTDIELR